jgi:MFS family permease
VQGLGGALLLPSTLAIINTFFAKGRERNRALAVWGGFGASGLTVGALLGGVFTDGFGWPAVFFVNVPLAAAVIIGVLASVPRDERATVSRRFDLPGMLTATIGATAVVFALVEGPEIGWGSTGVIVAAAVGTALLAVFFHIEARSKDPLLPPALLRNRSLAAAAATTFVFMGTFGVLPYFLTTVLFGSKYDFSALDTGLAFLVPSVAIFAGTQIGERYTTARGARAALVAGFAVGAAETVALAFAFTADAGFAAAVPALVISGIGQGIVWTAMFAAAGTGVDPARAGVANAVATTTLNVGNAVGLGAVIAVASAAATAEQGGFIAVLVTAAGMAIGLLIALTLPRHATA